MEKDQIKQSIEAALADLPVVQYAWLSGGDIEFSERVRSICRQECPRYAKSWSCPPGVGTVEQCRSRCSAYEGCFVFTTIVEVNDASNIEETLATRAGHEAVMREIRGAFGALGVQTLALSGESCAVCETCAYPKEPCRHPEQMLPCMEGYGIIVPLLAEKAGISFENGSNVVTWFGLLLF